MARLSLVEEKQFSPEYAQLVERVRDAQAMKAPTSSWETLPVEISGYE